MQRNGQRGKSSKNPNFAVVSDRTPEVNHHWRRTGNRHSDSGVRDINYNPNSQVVEEDGLLLWA